LRIIGSCGMVLSKCDQTRVKCTQEKTTIPWKTRRYFALFPQLFGALAAGKNGWLYVLNLGISNARSKAQTIKMRIEK